MVGRSGNIPPDDFVALLRDCDDRMRALAFSMLGSAQFMDDVLQDAYLKAYRAFEGFRRESSFATWLGSIVYRCCIDHGRAVTRRQITAIGQDGLENIADEFVSEEVVDAHLDVVAALQKLSADHRAVLVLVDLEGLTLTETSQMLDVPIGTAASRLSRARKGLQRVLVEAEDLSMAEESR